MFFSRASSQSVIFGGDLNMRDSELAEVIATTMPLPRGRTPARIEAFLFYSPKNKKILLLMDKNIELLNFSKVF
jgi:hypothetical protein